MNSLEKKDLEKNVVCLKWGNKFGPEYVNQLYKMVEKNLTIPHRFICFTNEPEGIEKGIEIFPLPEVKIQQSGKEKCWKKLAIFNKNIGNLKGQVLCLDIDVVVIGNIDELFEIDGDFRIINNSLLQWNHPKNNYIGASGCFRFNANEHNDVIEYFENNFDKIKEKFYNEQEYLSWAMKEKGILQYWKPETAISFKHGCMSSFPLNIFTKPKHPGEKTKLLMFHGNPLPHEAIKGYFTLKRPQRICRPTDWLKEYWKI